MSAMAVGLLLWAGTGLLLSSLGIVRRPTLAARIGICVPMQSDLGQHQQPLSHDRIGEAQSCATD